MRWRYIAPPLIAVAFLCGSCAGAPDVRDRMLRASQSADPDFPDGLEQKLTHFAYIGDLRAGRTTVRVVAARAIITGMPAPRGRAWLGFYNKQGSFLGKHAIDSGSPALWCEDSRVYFFGLQTDGEERGNALEFRDGLERPRYVFAAAEGSWMPSADGHVFK